MKGTDLDERLLALPERQWQTASNGKPLTAQWRGRRLNRYGIRTVHLRLDGDDGKQSRGYRRADFEGPWSAYLDD